jgi:hypothetical protein
LGLHSYWVELQSIRNKRQERTPFFTIERFSKYLQVICSEILTLKAPDSPETPSLGITSLSLLMHGENLLLLVEEQQKKTPYLLHRFTGNPYDFFEYLFKHPDKDATPADFAMHTNSASNLLDRTNIKGTLRTLFFQKGSRKGSIQLPSAHFQLKNSKSFDTNMLILLSRHYGYFLRYFSLFTVIFIHVHFKNILSLQPFGEQDLESI